MFFHRTLRLAPACLIAAASGLPASPAAAHRLEPIDTEYAAPFAPGAGVFKIGCGHNAFEAAREDEAEAEIELGLLPRLQISLGQAYVWQKGRGRRRSGFTNLETGLRYLVAGGGSHPYAFSVNPGFTPVTGSRRVREGLSNYGASLNADYYGKSGWLFFSNVGFGQASRGEDGDPRERTVFYRLAAVHNLSYRWSPTVELLGEHDVASGRHELTLVPEIQFFKSQWIEFKLGAPVKLSHGAGRLGVRFQATFGLGRGSHG